jgi:TonB family protein
LDTNRTYFDGPFEDYDSTGRLMLTGTYLTGKKNGPCTVYHLNGKKDSHGNFLNNAMQGKWEYHYPNGKLKQEIEFKDSDYRILSFYDSLGNQLVTDGTGNWYDHFGENQQRILLARKVVNGFREGQWRLQDHTQALLLEEEFREGKFVSGTYYPGKSKQHYDKSLLGKSIFEHPHLALAELLKADNCFYGPDAIDYILGKDPFKDVDPNLIASFPGGDEQFAKFMAKNLRFPTAALQRNGESRVIVEFIVDETGRLSNFKIRQGVTTELNFEAVRVMKLSPPWFPARLPEGTPQKARVAVPVLFRVETRKSQ